MGGRRWKQCELELLEEMIDTHTLEQIAEEFNRPVGSIYHKIRELKENAR